MSTNTTNLAMGKAVDGDNAKTYLETTLGAALDKIDAHDHSGTTHGISTLGALTSVVVASGGLTVTAPPVIIGTTPAAAGSIRLPNNVTANWRNAANSADNSIGFNGSDRLSIVTTAANIATSATTGGATALPANPAGYIVISLQGGGPFKIPYYN